MTPLRVLAALDLGAGRTGHRVRRWTALAILAVGVLVGVPAVAQEPVVLTGTWIGTWWIGKYEEPVELYLTQTRQDLAGQVVLWGYPRAGASPAPAAVRAPITGTVDGPRARFTWTTPEHGQFWVELTILSQDRLFGLGGVGATTAGFGLHRSP
jgi:hypothetical protein